MPALIKNLEETLTKSFKSVEENLSKKIDDLEKRIDDRIETLKVTVTDNTEDIKDLKERVVRLEKSKVHNNYNGERRVRDMEEKEEFFAIARKRIGLSPFTEEDIARNTEEGETYKLNKDLILMRSAVEFLETELKLSNDEIMYLDIEQFIKTKDDSDRLYLCLSDEEKVLYLY